MIFPDGYDRNAEILEKRLTELSPTPEWRVLRAEEMEGIKFPFPILYLIECKLEINGKTLKSSTSIMVRLFDSLGSERTAKRLQFQFASAFGGMVFSIEKYSKLNPPQWTDPPE